MRCVVTGGAGFIGSHLTERLLHLGHDVLVIDDLSSGKNHVALVEAAGAILEELDIRGEPAGKALVSFAPDVVFHLAAQLSVRLSVTDPLFDASVNVLGTIRMLEASRDARARFVNTSSGGAMYGELSDGSAGFSEEDQGRPTSPYGITKKVGEDYVRFYAAQFGMRFVSLAPGNVYGPRQDPHGEAGVVAIFAGSLIEGRECVIYGDGKQVRDFVYVEDVVDAYVVAMKKGDGESFNIGTGRSTSIEDLFFTMARLARVDASPLYEAAKPGDALRVALDVSKAERQLGWKAQINLDDGLSRTLETFRS